MDKGRLEAFSDGVIAIIITITVLQMEIPHGDRWKELIPLAPVFLSYMLSFVYVGIDWNNHHHMLHASTTVTGAMLWANLHLLFWLSLFSFATGWMGENHFTAAPTALYGVVLLMAAVAYYLLQRTIIRAQGSRFDSQKSGRAGLERKALADAVCRGDRRNVTFSVAGAGHFRFSGVDMAGSGSAHQARAAARSGIVDRIRRSCHTSIGGSISANTTG